MGSPCSVEGDQAPSIHSPAEDVLWDENPLVPKEYLALLRGIGDVFPLADPLEPLPIRVVSVFEPFIDEQIRGVAIKGLANEFRHRERGRVYGRVTFLGHPLHAPGRSVRVRRAR